MLDTVVQQNNSDMILKVLQFGTKKLFEDDSLEPDALKEYKLDEEALKVVLDREGQLKSLVEEEKTLDAD